MPNWVTSDNPKEDENVLDDVVSVGKKSVGGYIPRNVYIGNTNTLQLPHFSIKDIYNERILWQKSLSSIGGEPNYSYFKIFFDFENANGLLSDVLFNIVDSNGNKRMTNSAIQYLENISGHHRYKVEHLKKQLKYFVFLLSYINTRAPWFFKAIKGLDQADTNEYSLRDLTKDKFIEIECSEDAIDMTLETLMSLYKSVAIDTINQREVLPENLRKFNFDVLVYSVPIKYFQTAFTYRDTQKSHADNQHGFKNFFMTVDNEFDNLASFKLFRFKNCEFQTEGMTTIPNQMNNEQPFISGKNTIKIKYGKLLQLQFNEWQQLMVGDGKFGSRYSEAQKKRIKTLIDASKTRNYNMFSGSSQKALVDAMEDILCDTMQAITGENALGNLYEGISIFGEQQPDNRTLEGMGQSVRSILDFPKTVENSAKNFWGRLKDTGMQYSSKNISAKFMEGFRSDNVNTSGVNMEEFLAMHNEQSNRYNEEMIAERKKQEGQVKQRQEAMCSVYGWKEGSSLVDDNSETNVERSVRETKKPTPEMTHQDFVEQYRKQIKSYDEEFARQREQNQAIIKTKQEQMRSAYGWKDGSYMSDDNSNTNVDRTVRSTSQRKEQNSEDFFDEYKKRVIAYGEKLAKERVDNQGKVDGRHQSMSTQYDWKGGLSFYNNNPNTNVDRNQKTSNMEERKATYNWQNGSSFKDENLVTNVERSEKQKNTEQMKSTYNWQNGSSFNDENHNTNVERSQKTQNVEEIKTVYNWQDGTIFQDDNTDTNVDRSTSKQKIHYDSLRNDTEEIEETYYDEETLRKRNVDRQEKSIKSRRLKPTFDWKQGQLFGQDNTDTNVDRSQKARMKMSAKEAYERMFNK